jgi:uncharacterized protein (DUF362 family)
MMSHGPSGQNVENPTNVQVKKTILLSRDIVAVDAAATKIFGREPEEIGYIKMAHAQKIGNMNLKELKIVTFAM